MAKLLYLIVVLGDALEETTDATTAVETMLKYIKEFFETPIVTVGGTTLTIGLLIFAILKFFLPKNATITNQEKTIDELQEENTELKESNADLKARVETLEAQMNVVVTNTPNTKVRAAKDLKIAPAEVKPLNANVTKTMRKVKVKVKKKAKKLIEAGTEAVVNG